MNQLYVLSTVIMTNKLHHMTAERGRELFNHRIPRVEYVQLKA